MITRLDKENDSILIRNEKICREIRFRFGRPVRSVVTRAETGYGWDTGDDCELLSLPGYDFASGVTEYDDETRTVTFRGAYTVLWKFELSPALPAIRSQLTVKTETPVVGENAVGRIGTDTLGHAGRHLTLRSADFFDQSDRVDCFVREEKRYLYVSPAEVQGRIFFAADPTNGESCVLWKEAPLSVSDLSPMGCDLRATVRSLKIFGAGIDLSVPGEWEGYPVVTLLCGTGEEEALCRAWFAECAGGLGSYIMSNTWGDRSQADNVYEEFLKKEILAGERLGVDVVQIDAGWAIGTPDILDGLVEGSSYDQNPDCWKPDPARFPSGLPALCDFAREHGRQVGLWFSPDSHRDYACWEKDADSMLALWRSCGIRHFKLDGIDLPNKASETNFRRMCRKVLTETAGEVDFQLDITNQRRTGPFFDRQFGSLFVENRYTDWTNYYPHNTFRNLWQLSRYIPAQKLQFEVLNPRRNAQNYGDDPLAPNTYEEDYLFATVMVASPLIWMEMQFLGEEDSRRLSSMAAVCRQYREDFRDIRPIGECPDGYALSGFMISGEKQDYALLIRELSEKDRFAVSADRVLVTNDEGLVCGEKEIVFSGKRKYALVTLKK